MQELPTLCGLCGMRYGGAECPTSRAELEAAKTVIEERRSQEREEKARIMRDLEDCSEDQGEHKARWVT